MCVFIGCKLPYFKKWKLLKAPLCIRGSSKAIKVIKINTRRLKIVLGILSNVYIAYPETAEYIESNMMELYLREKLPEEEIFYLLFLS